MSTPSPQAVTPGRTRLTAIALMCGAVVCFSLLDTNAKWLALHGADPLLVSFARYGVSVALVFFLINPWSHPGVMRAKRPWLQLLRSLLLLASTVLNFFALRYLQLAQTISIMFAAPLLVSLASGPLLGEWPGPRRLAAIGVGFLGVLVVTRPGVGNMHPAALLSVIGCVCYAFYALTTRVLAASDSSETTMVYSGLAGAIALLPAVPFVWSWPQDPRAWGAFLATGFLGAIGHWMLILAHRMAPATVLAPFIYSQLIWMLLLGWLVFDQLPDGWTFAGGAVVVASGLYLLYRERVRKLPEAASSVQLD